MKTKRLLVLAVYMLLGSCLALVAVAWQPCWRVERPTGHLADMPPGNFWEFLQNLPGAVENLSVPQTPENILTILPTAYLWENVRTTLVILAVGATLGVAVRWIQQWGNRRST